MRIKSFKSRALAFLATLWCTVPIWADDTEIFFGDTSGSGARPNVLFIIDTSGSMDGEVDGTGKDRLDNVKDAMYQLMEELNNVNIGLMRFTNPGGPVLHPVKYIDEDVNAGSIITVDTPVSAANDDAQEILSTGQMILDGERLEIINATSVGFDSFDDQVSSGDDDAEEFVDSGTSWTYSGVLDLDINRRIGVRFSGSSVPDNAVITNAFLRFTGVNSGNSEPLALRIYGQQDDVSSFAGTDYELRDKADSVAYVDWNISSTVAADQTIDTPNIAPIVQEIVDNAVWDPAGGGEDDMVFIVVPQPTASGSGARDFYSENGSSSRAPKLYIEYYVGTAPGSGPSKVGLRFDSAAIPRGVTITNAYVAFTAERDFSSSHDLTISAESTGDAMPFTVSAGDISGRTLGAPLAWSGSLSHSAGDTFATPNLASVIEGVTGRGDWCGGNALSLVIDGSSGELPVWAFEGSASLSPRLIVQYEYDSIPVGSSCIRRTINRSIASSADDAEETGGSATTTSGDLDFYDGSNVGLRFTDLGLPQGATILEAKLRFIADADDSGTTSMSIAAEAADDAASYSGTDGTIDDRSYLASTISWSESTSWSTNDVIDSPDISSLVSSVVARAGWEPGNAMAFRIETSTSTDREAESIDGSPAEAPRLIVDFEDDGSGITNRKVRDEVASLVDQLNHNGWTPIQDTLYEAALYYAGEPVKWGATRGDAGIDGGPFSYARVSAAASMEDGTYSINRPAGCSEDNLDDSDCEGEYIAGVGGSATYESPITDFCQAQSHVILLTDGEANRPHSESLVEDFIGGSCANEATVNEDGSTTDLTDGEYCVKDLAAYMNENDMRPTLNGQQRVTTHTIGFNFSSQWLEDVATAGGGLYKTANNASELVDQINQIIGEVLKTDSTFVAPVVAVNEFNQLSHLSQVYFAVFRPDEFPRWRGNLKKYELGDEVGTIVDSVGNLAIDPETGFFRDTSRSFWSSTTDGPSVDIGGAAEQLPTYSARNLYTYYSGSVSTNLTDGANAVTTANTNLTDSMLDVVGFSATELADHIEWIRGRDVDDEDEDLNSSENRYYFGDPLHSRPVAVTYGGTEDAPDVEIFFGTNAGTLQSINAATGEESFAFIPEALLPVQKTLRENRSSTNHPYGMDGAVAIWVNDEDRDDIDPLDADDFVRLYSGMRRGGRNYYALDVTDRTSPELMWQIIGGQVQSNGDDFSELGQTWSRPIKTRIILSGDAEPRDVLIFSGGYDDAQDEASQRTVDSMGRAMYIVDATTGALIWAGGKTGVASMDESFDDMDYSFPSTNSVVDINQDGLADMWFAADTGGQVWRFDIQNGSALSSLVSGGVIANLGVAGGANTAERNRRFFSSPSVALVRGPSGPEMTVAIGSGFRPSPLSYLASNRMYMIRQQAVFAAPASYTTVTESDLYNATANTLATAEGDDLAAEQALLYAADGWYFDLTASGEKVLSSPLIANGQIIFTTYTPGNSLDAGLTCKPAAGRSRAYAVRLEDAVRTTPQPLLTPSIVDQATIIVPPPAAAEDDPDDPDGDDEEGDDEGGDACPNGNNIVIKLNAEDGPVDTWCNDATKTYWLKDR